MNEEQFRELKRELGNILFELNYMRKSYDLSNGPSYSGVVLLAIIVSVITTLIALHL